MNPMNQEDVESTFLEGGDQDQEFEVIHEAQDYLSNIPIISKETLKLCSNDAMAGLDFENLLGTMPESKKELLYFIDLPMPDKSLRIKFNWFHVFVIHSSPKDLEQFLAKNKDSIDFLANVEIVSKQGLNKVKLDEWIFAAKCFHLAIKFSVENLPILLHHYPAIEENLKKELLALSAKNNHSLCTKVVLDKGTKVDKMVLENAIQAGSLPNTLELLKASSAKCDDFSLMDVQDNKVAQLLLDNEAQIYEKSNKDEPDGCKAIEMKKEGTILGLDPEIMETVLDHCIKEVKDDLIVVDLEPFLKTTDDQNEMNVHELVQKHKKKELLVHPVMETFLQLKWNQMKTYFITHLATELVFVLTLSYVCYGFSSMTFCEGIGNHTKEVEPELFKIQNDIILEKLNSTHSRINETGQVVQMICSRHFPKTNEERFFPMEPICEIKEKDITCWLGSPSKMLLTIFLVAFLGKELVELFSGGCRSCKSYKNYFKSFENILDLLMVSFSFAFILSAPAAMEIAVHFGAWAMFIAWIDLTLLLGRLDYLGEYIYMSFYVTKKLLLSLLVYLPTFFAFTLAFKMLLNTNPTFQNILGTFIKVIVMMLGEVDFSANFVHYKVEEVGGRIISVQILFLIFVVFISMIIMNLLVALTVSTTEELIKEGGIFKARKRVNDVRKMADILRFSRILRRLISYGDWIVRLIFRGISCSKKKVEKRFMARSLMDRFKKFNKNEDTSFMICVKPKEADDSFLSHFKGGKHKVYFYKCEKGQGKTKRISGWRLPDKIINDIKKRQNGEKANLRKEFEKTVEATEKKSKELYERTMSIM